MSILSKLMSTMRLNEEDDDDYYLDGDDSYEDEDDRPRRKKRSTMKSRSRRIVSLEEAAQKLYPCAAGWKLP